MKKIPDRFMQLYYLDKYQKTRRTMWFFAMLFYVTFFLCLYLIFNNLLSSYEIKYSNIAHSEKDASPVVMVNWTDLTPEEGGIALETVKKVKGKYFIGTNSITFSKNLTALFPEYHENLGGLNFLGGVVYVQYNDDTASMEISLCHELLHTFMLRDEAAHAVIYDLARYRTCYKDNPPQGVFFQ